MAYGYRPRRRTRRAPYRRRPSSRRVYRRPSRKTTLRPRRMMSKRKILNVASTKKHDNMISTFIPATGNPVVGTGVTLVGNKTYRGLWCATSRDMTSNTNIPGDPALRTSNVCYMRGLKERDTFVTNSPASWRWRRICFTAKGLVFQSPTEVETSSTGWARMILDFTNNASDDAFLQTLLFQGAQGSDWNDPFTAKVDTTRVTLKSDVTQTFNSGNAVGKFFNRKFWYPMNKNLVYSTDETGGQVSNDYKSTLGKPGMGDYYVFDMFQCSSNSSSDTLLWNPEATLYWHEK